MSGSTGTTPPTAAAAATSAEGLAAGALAAHSNPQQQQQHNHHQQQQPLAAASHAAMGTGAGGSVSTSSSPLPLPSAFHRHGAGARSEQGLLSATQAVPSLAVSGIVSSGSRSGSGSGTGSPSTAHAAAASGSVSGTDSTDSLLATVRAMAAAGSSSLLSKDASASAGNVSSSSGSTFRGSSVGASGAPHHHRHLHPSHLQYEASSSSSTTSSAGHRASTGTSSSGVAFAAAAAAVSASAASAGGAGQPASGASGASGASRAAGAGAAGAGAAAPASLLPVAPNSPGKTTVLDLGDDEDGTTPVASWGRDGSSVNSNDSSDPAAAALKKKKEQDALRAKKLRRRKKRSPNRDYSDSEDDEDDEGHGSRDADCMSPESQGDEGGDDDDSDDYDPSKDPNYTPYDDEESVRAGFKVGFSEDRNKKYRRTMEDSHTIVYNYGETSGAGFFAVFDGHAGRTAADFCGNHLHEIFLQLLKEQPDTPIPDLLNQAFLATDKQLAQRKGMHSGCTAIVAYMRTEDRHPAGSDPTDPTVPRTKQRVLYTANVGDARAVLCRDGTAVRLSYDHKGSDQQEARRILEAGGFVMNNRVNGVLAVTRSLGDLSMKEWVIGNPYTTETVLNNKDSFLVLACDGVWDVCTDQQGLDIIKDIPDPQEAADTLLDYALDNFSTDNLTVIVARLNPLFDSLTAI